MENKEDLLNLNNNKKDIKKPLIIGAGIFVIFVIGVIIFGIVSNKKEENNVVAPPKDNLFKEVPIETTPTPKEDSLKQKLLQSEEMPKPVEPPVQEVKKEVKPQKPEPMEKAPEPVKKVEKPIKKPIEKKEVNVVRNYYIQVAALMKHSKPNPRFLKLIQQNGFNYTILNVDIKKGNKEFRVKKILIGPFTKEEARKELKIIKAKINQNAFIFRMK